MGAVRPGQPRFDEAIVKTARKAVGDDARLMVDAGGSDAFWPNGYKWALRTSAMLAGYGVDWFEEPLKPDALDDFVALRRHAPLPIAGGEVLTRRQSFLPWLAVSAFDVVQPDVTKVGGISEGSGSAGWRRSMASASSRTAGTPRSAWPPISSQRLPRHRSRRIHHRLRLRRQADGGGLSARRRWHAGDPGPAGVGVTLDPDAVERFSGVRL